MNNRREHKAVVAVPVHLAHPSAAEIVSLRQCGKVLASREIVIVAPQGLDLGAYKELLPRAQELRVEPHWMSSIQAYNRMMISPLLYEAFSGYTHMLLHEPDALVLRDELDFWCDQTFDYVGAPWFEGYAAAAHDAPIIGVGNSGFSLHRLDASRRCLAAKRRWYPFGRALKDLARGLQGSRHRLRRGLMALGPAGQLRGAWQLYTGHCDLFWSGVVPALCQNYKVATAEQAVRFSWEVLPSRCIEMTQGKLPFGLHAWAKYDASFLTPHLIAAGVDLNGFEI